MIISNNILQRILAFLEKTFGSGSITVNTSGTTSSMTVEQSNPDDLNINANLQVGDSDVSSSNPIPVTGTVADGDVDSGNTIKIGGIATAVTETAVDAGDRVPLITDLLKRLIIASYDRDLDSLNVNVINPTNKDYIIPVVLVDTINLGAGTNYYPDSNGQNFDTFKDLVIQVKGASGVTFTVEAHADNSVTNDWVDVTKSAYDMITATNNNASYIDTQALLSWSELNIKAFRIKVVTSDSSNTVKISYRLRY